MLLFKTLPAYAFALGMHFKLYEYLFAANKRASANDEKQENKNEKMKKEKIEKEKIEKEKIEKEKMEKEKIEHEKRKKEKIENEKIKNQKNEKLKNQKNEEQILFSGAKNEKDTHEGDAWRIPSSEKEKTSKNVANRQPITPITNNLNEKIILFNDTAKPLTYDILFGRIIPNKKKPNARQSKAKMLTTKDIKKWKKRIGQVIKDLERQKAAKQSKGKDNCLPIPKCNFRLPSSDHFIFPKCEKIIVRKLKGGKSSKVSCSSESSSLSSSRVRRPRIKIKPCISIPPEQCIPNQKCEIEAPPCHLPPIEKRPIYNHEFSSHDDYAKYEPRFLNVGRESKSTNLNPDENYDYERYKPLKKITQNIKCGPSCGPPHRKPERSNDLITPIQPIFPWGPSLNQPNIQRPRDCSPILPIFPWGPLFDRSNIPFPGSLPPYQPVFQCGPSADRPNIQKPDIWHMPPWKIPGNSSFPWRSESGPGNNYGPSNNTNNQYAPRNQFPGVNSNITSEPHFYMPQNDCSDGKRSLMPSLDRIIHFIHNLCTGSGKPGSSSHHHSDATAPTFAPKESIDSSFNTFTKNEYNLTKPETNEIPENSQTGICTPEIKPSESEKTFVIEQQQQPLQQECEKEFIFVPYETKPVCSSDICIPQDCELISCTRLMVMIDTLGDKAKTDLRTILNLKLQKFPIVLSGAITKLNETILKEINQLNTTLISKLNEEFVGASNSNLQAVSNLVTQSNSSMLSSVIDAVNAAMIAVQGNIVTLAGQTNAVIVGTIQDLTTSAGTLSQLLTITSNMATTIQNSIDDATNTEISEINGLFATAGAELTTAVIAEVKEIQDLLLESIIMAIPTLTATIVESYLIMMDDITTSILKIEGALHKGLNEVIISAFAICR